MTCYVKSVNSSLWFLGCLITILASSITSAETEIAERGGLSVQFDVNINDKHVKLLRWAVQVASDAVAAQAGADGIPREEATLIIDQLGQMEDHVVDQVIKIVEGSDNSDGEGQITLF